MKVLVAEDTKANLLFLCDCIRELGHEVITASNGIEALEMFEQGRPDLVLLDVIMPEMDGITTAHEIRTRTISSHQWVPIIFISAMGDDKDVVKGLEVGGDDYITKPVSQTVLKAKLNAMERIYLMQKELDITNHKLRQLSESDALTGLANRRKFNDCLQREWKRSARSALPLTLCILDVDYFKSFNDNYGHTIGDEALIKIAECLGQNVKRSGDVVARYGGEEFALILPETDIDGACVILEKVRTAIEDLGIRHEFSSIAQGVTVSLGSMTIIPARNESPENAARLVLRADKALYKAKETGRNRIVSRAQFDDAEREQDLACSI